MLSSVYGILFWFWANGSALFACFKLAEHLDEEQIGWAGVSGHEVSHGGVQVEFIFIAASFAVAMQVAGGFEFGNDALNGAFSDADLRSDFLELHSRVIDQAEHNQGMIA